MELWGAALFGQPCSECRFGWSLSPDHAVAVIAEAPPKVEKRVQAARGDERRAAGGWSVSEYVSHVSDNLRNWAERVQAARLAGFREVAAYDPDELARVRGYGTLPLEVAVWSLQISCDLWVPVMRAALEEKVVLHHETRGISELRTSPATTLTTCLITCGISIRSCVRGDRRVLTFTCATRIFRAICSIGEHCRGGVWPAGGVPGGTLAIADEVVYGRDRDARGWSSYFWNEAETKLCAFLIGNGGC